eukprot:TRINITY_DN624_c0_g4_i1.p1 TRINITY_DN624_c0_g4~~TRINITY_DN624_c0_g4_i1.p1  ORF type:complete len:841 (+),score=157.99 TRINITY_DN624_c0_g4_i1:48-2525(+)
MPTRWCTRAADAIGRTCAKPGDSAEEVRLKKWAAIFSISCGLLTTVTSAIRLATEDVVSVNQVLTPFAALYLLARMLPKVLFSTTCIRVVLEEFCLVLSVLIAIANVEAGAVHTVNYASAAVVLLDFALVGRVRQSIQYAVIVVTLLSLTIEGVESSLRLGLYEVAYFGGDVPDGRCACADPPCRVKPTMAFFRSLVVGVMILTDYALTRRFALGMHRQIELAKVSVRTAGGIAELLANYSIADAQRMLESDSSKPPPELIDSFRTLLSNLERYRPYLPDSLTQRSDLHVLPPISPIELATPVQSPLLPGSGTRFAIVFTDCESGTELWECKHQAMYEALHVHNAEMRTAAAENNGYESKSIGDAFMFAFSSATDAVCFGMDAHRRLLRASWPAELIEHELCKPIFCGGALLWKGLRVRIGMHYGHVLVERNPVTLREEFVGPTVNVASRIESAVKYGGFTGATAEVLTSIDVGELDRPELYCLGVRDLKGFGHAVVHVILPAELADRLQLFEPEGRRARAASLSSTAVSSPPTTTVHADTVGSRNSGGLSLPQLCLGLTPTTGTCASVWVVLPDESRLVSEHLSEALAKVEATADWTKGAILAVVSSQILVTWTVHHSEVHEAQALRFLSSCSRGAQQIHAGFATGRVALGNVAGVRRRFATVVGGALEMCSALSQAAVLSDDLALALGSVATFSRNVGCAFRAHVWNRTPEKKYIVWELVPWPGDDLDDKWSLFLTGATTCLKPSALDTALVAAAAAGPNAYLVLDRMLEDVPDDDEHKEALLQRAARGAVREIACPVVWSVCERDDFDSDSCLPSAFAPSVF